MAYDDDPDRQNMLAVFDDKGHGTSYYKNGGIKLCMDPYGGMELDHRGFKKRRWSWKEQVTSLHAMHIQPLTMSLSVCVSLRVMAQDNMILTFTCNQKTIKFQVGVRLTALGPDAIPESEIEEYTCFKEDLEYHIQNLLLQVSGLLKSSSKSRHSDSDQDKLLLG